MFGEQKDDFDAFIATFEGLATYQKWPKDQLAIYHCTLLPLEVIHRMKTVNANNFDKVKEGLMQNFRLTKESFRPKMRTCRPEKNIMTVLLKI